MRFRVNGTPAPQGSKRHVGGGRMVEMSKAVGPWREAVRAEAQRSWHPPAYISPRHADKIRTDVYWAITPLSVDIRFILRRPAGHYGKGRNAAILLKRAPQHPKGRPDVDKLARAVLDGLVMGGVMADDSQVVRLVAVKVYAANGEAPGAEIEVEAL